MTQDNKWHNLTDNTFLLASKESVDKVIRNWLELKAKEISVFLPTKHKDDEMRKILGLSPVEGPMKESLEHEFIAEKLYIEENGRLSKGSALVLSAKAHHHFGINIDDCLKCKHVEDKVGEWCGHIQMPCGDGKPTFKGGVIVYEDWKCCPICGAKRPEKKSLAEKFMGVRSTHQPFSDFIDEIQADYLAKIATAHFHNEQNEG